ncbi:fumarate hydratase C-terminal domain-containing protein [Candidatus Woesearchaeota archaeon]|nr:fumarate hydratase C-terminal domain-containing protein [Candidatus Woesearchaeota archaeon]
MDFTKLRVGDKVNLNGTVFTARDKASIFLLENDFQKIRNGIIYHCGPLIKNNKVISAGPTTSARMNQYAPELIKKYNIKAIIGKGGMDEKVLNALKGRAVYFSAVGGAGALYAKKMKVVNVYKKEFGMPEAIWEFEVRDFPVTVTMDSKGNSLYDEIKEMSRRKLNF